MAEARLGTAILTRRHVQGWRCGRLLQLGSSGIDQYVLRQGASAAKQLQQGAQDEQQLQWELQQVEQVQQELQLELLGSRHYVSNGRRELPA